MVIKGGKYCFNCKYSKEENEKRINCKIRNDKSFPRDYWCTSWKDKAEKTLEELGWKKEEREDSSHFVYFTKGIVCVQFDLLSKEVKVYAQNKRHTAVWIRKEELNLINEFMKEI